MELNMDRVPPHDLDSEKALLGAMMLAKDAIDNAAELIEGGDFYREAHRTIFEAIVDLHGQGKNVDVVCLASYLDSLGMLERVGGKGYLLEVINSCALASHSKEYAETIRERSKFRRLINVGMVITATGYETPEDSDEVISDAISDLMSISTNINDDSKPCSLINQEFLRDLNSPKPYYISIPWLPWVKARKGDLVIVAGGPSVGKTAVALNWADEWSKEHQVTYFEYEMTEADLMARLICKHAGVTWDQILERNLTTEEMNRIEVAGRELSSRKLRIKEVWCKVGQLIAKIRQEHKRGTEVVIIDHLSLVPFSMPKGLNYAKAVGMEVTARLKRLASELGIVIVLLSQINREGQKGDFPKLWHLKDSGEIEQDASIVVMLWSEKSVQDDPARKLSIRESSDIIPTVELFKDFELIRISAEKNRNGALGKRFVIFHGEHFEYEERPTLLNGMWETEKEPLPLFEIGE
jgi:replicative DNA helicase